MTEMRLTRNGFHLRKHSRIKGYKIANVDAIQTNSSLETKYPMLSQSEKHPLLQTKMVKIYTLFQTKTTQSHTFCQPPLLSLLIQTHNMI